LNINVWNCDFYDYYQTQNEAQMFNAFQDATTSKMASIYKTVVQLFINYVCIFLNSFLLF